MLADLLLLPHARQQSSGLLCDRVMMKADQIRYDVWTSTGPCPPHLGQFPKWRDFSVALHDFRGHLCRRDTEPPPLLEAFVAAETKFAAFFPPKSIVLPPHAHVAIVTSSSTRIRASGV